MKREGRQHGVVNYHETLPGSSSQQRLVNTVDSGSTMGLFAKVSKKPTNHSKNTGKCRRPRCNRCHIHPVCKSRDKAKGTMKIRSLDAGNELTKYSLGTSAKSVLAYLADDGGYYNNDYDDIAEENDNYGYGYDDYYSNYDESDGTRDIDLRVGFGLGIGIVTSFEADGNDVIDDDDDDDDVMSFCDVGLCWGHEDGDENGDGDWYLVGGEML